MRLWILLAVLARAAVSAQAPAKPLQIANAGVQQFEDGPPAAEGNQFVAGETVFFSFQVTGYRVSGDRKVQLSYRIQVTDSEGINLVEETSGKLETELADEDKEWLPKVRRSFVIPPHALPGKFKIAAWVADASSSQEAKADTPFDVRGRQVESSDTLVVRNVRFLRAEEDREPLSVAAYRAGDTLWARFDITGFKLGEKNRIDVSYGISIVSPSGKVLFSEPQAAVEQDAPFYPKRYVPGIASLGVQPKTTPGEYTLVITARDQVGGQACESRHTFRIQ